MSSSPTIHGCTNSCLQTKKWGQIRKQEQMGRKPEPPLHSREMEQILDRRHTIPTLATKISTALQQKVGAEALDPILEAASSSTPNRPFLRPIQRAADCLGMWAPDGGDGSGHAAAAQGFKGHVANQKGRGATPPSRVI